MKRLLKLTHLASLLALLAPGALYASSHMDAPLITLDDAANTTDVYAFVSQSGSTKYLTVALAVYPFEEPGIGPNKYNFDDNVLYEIHVATGGDVARGLPTWTYQFEFDTRFKNSNTILQSYLGVINDVDDAAQNLTQTYKVWRVHKGKGRRTFLGSGVVPPNNQGIATPFYNQDNDGENPARDGAASAGGLDKYTAQAIASLAEGHRAFAGQREDGFYADIQAIFDLLQLRNPGKDNQGGFNLHTMVLSIPVSQLGGDMQIAGVYATTSRRHVRVLRDERGPKDAGPWIPVGRQGNPLFCEALVALKDKDLYNQTQPDTDSTLFMSYATNPELAGLLNAIVFKGANVAPTTNRSDIAGIFIPDLIKVDLSTGRARLAGGGPTHPNTPDDPGFNRLGIFGNDVLISQIQAGFGGGVVPGGWPNGRRFGDDVVDIAVTALISDLRTSPPTIRGPAGDNVDKNDAVYNKVFPYAGTPHNGRIHGHHGAGF